MEKIVFIFLMIFLLRNNLHSQQPDGTIYFGTGKATLNRESKTQLKNLIEKIKNNKSPRVMISGFTDVNGSTESNLILSKKRALAVSDFLTTNGVEKTKITVRFFGEDKPTTKNEKSLRENRRVEITIRFVKNDEKASFGIFGKLWEKPLKHRFSETKIAANEELNISGPRGTKIWIPANSLCRPNGELARGDIDIELTEYYKKSEILLANLHTASDSIMLETRGMFYVAALCGGERLSLKKGSEIKIEFPIPDSESDMGIFIGSRTGNQMNWRPQSNVAEETYKNDEKNPSKTDNLTLGSGHLGLIICKRFSKVETKTNLFVQIDPMFNAIVRLVFKDLNAIMPGYTYLNGTSKVINIPLGQKATIVAFGMIKETPYFISKDIVIGDNQIEKLVPKETTFEALRTVLKKVN